MPVLQPGSLGSCLNSCVPCSPLECGCHSTAVFLFRTPGRGNRIKKKWKKTKQMQNLCIWGLLFLWILRAYGGTLVYSCLGYVIDLLPMKCNSFSYSSGFCQRLKMNRVSAYLQPKITHWLCCPRTSRSCTAAWAVPGRGALLLFCWISWGSCGPLSPACSGPSMESRCSSHTWDLGEINTHEWKHLHTETSTTEHGKKKAFPSHCNLQNPGLPAVTPLPIGTRSC